MQENIISALMGTRLSRDEADKLIAIINTRVFIVSRADAQAKASWNAVERPTSLADLDALATSTKRDHRKLATELSDRLAAMDARFDKLEAVLKVMDGPTMKPNAKSAAEFKAIREKLEALPEAMTIKASFEKLAEFAAKSPAPFDLPKAAPAGVQVNDRVWTAQNIDETIAAFFANFGRKR